MTATAATRERVAAFLDTDYARVVGAVALATADREHAEDAVQDAIVKTLSSDAEPRNLAGWITVVAINYVRQGWRREGARERAYVRSVSFESTPDEQQTVDALAVHDAVSHLPRQQQLVVILHYYQGLSVAEIATTLGVSQGTVKTQMHRGRERLASALRKEVA